MTRPARPAAPITQPEYTQNADTEEHTMSATNPAAPTNPETTNLDTTSPETTSLEPATTADAETTANPTVYRHPAVQRPATHRRVTLTALALTIAMLFTACTPGFGGNDEIQSGEVYPTAPATVEIAGLYTASSTRAVVDADHILVYESPDGEALQTLPGATSYGTTRVMLVEAIAGDWVQVRLPTRPNHAVGWVKAADVTIESVKPVVHVDLDTRMLTVIADNEVLAQANVAVGSIENPTPVGTFYITDKLETPDPNGAYGPYAFGLSGYSETLSEFAGGNGQIGIHGTNDPTSIGQAVSHGCIRLPNEVAEWLAGVLPLGTPVHIV